MQKKINNSPRQQLKFETAKKCVLQKNIVVLHLLVDSTNQREIHTHHGFFPSKLAHSVKNA